MCKVIAVKLEHVVLVGLEPFHKFMECLPDLLLPFDLAHLNTVLVSEYIVLLRGHLIHTSAVHKRVTSICIFTTVYFDT